MPDVRNIETVRALAKEYRSSNYNKTKAMIAVGYDEEYAKTGHGQKVFVNVRVVEEIERLEGKEEEKLDLSREKQHQKLKEAFDIAKTGKNPAAMTSAVREQNEMLGYHRDTAPNAEKEAAKAKRMDSETRKVAEAVAKQRTDELSKGDKPRLMIHKEA